MIVDVREQSEYEEAHLNNGILVPLSMISAEKITEINNTKCHFDSVFKEQVLLRYLLI